MSDDAQVVTRERNVSRGMAITILALVAVLIGVIMSTLGGRIELIALGGGAAAIAGLALMLRLRSSELGRDVGLLQYLGFWLLGAATLLITYNALRITSFLTISDLLLVAVALIFALSALADRTPIITIPPWLSIGAIGLLSAGFLASFTANDLAHDLIASGEFAIALLGVPLLLARGTGNSARVLLIARVWLFSVVLSAGVAITDFVHLTSVGIIVAGRPTGLTVHPNHIGMICAMAVPVGLYMAICAKRLLERVVYLVALTVIGLGVLLSGSRAALLAALAGAILVPLFGRRLWKPVILIAAAAAVLLVATSLVASPETSASPTNPFVAIVRLTNEAAISGSDTARLDYYRTALSDFSAHPLTGVGFDLVRGAHDIYLQLLEAGGILAFATFLIFAVGSLMLGLRLTRSDALSDDLRNLAAALTASLAVWLLSGLVQNLVYDRFLYVPVGLLVGLNLAASVTRSASDAGLANAQATLHRR